MRSWEKTLLPSLAVMLLAAILGQASAAEDDARGVIRFRRILAPEDRIKDWPRGDEKYLPVDAAEFERLVAAMQPRPAGAPAVPPAAISAARYEAKLVGEQLVGQAWTDVVLTGTAPVVLPWEPCNLALGNVLSQTEKGNQPRTLVGLGSSGKLEGIVERSGQWRFDWSLAGRRDSADILGFSFEMPSAAAIQLSLELPKGFTPAVDRGLVAGSEPAGEESRRWQIELGGAHRFRLRVLPAGAASHRPQLALLRESRTYDFSLRGVEVTAHWKLQVHNQPLQQVAVLLDPELQLVSARCGEAALPWSAAPAAADRATRVLLVLPEPIRDAERVIRLVAVGKLTLDRPWRLPRIGCEGLFWQEGSLTLLTPEPLVADRLVPLGCGQTAVGPLSAPRTGESAQFQSFQPDATVEVLLSRRAAAVPARDADRLSGDCPNFRGHRPGTDRAPQRSSGRRWSAMVGENGTVPFDADSRLTMRLLGMVALLLIAALAWWKAFGAILLGVAIALSIVGPARGQSRPEAEKPAAASPMYSVFVPIDARKKPTGGKVYVPEPLYQELYRRAAAPAEKPQGWLIVGAAYRGALAPEGASGRLAVDALRAEYAVRVFGRAARVRIPLSTEGANLIPNGVLLDGRAIEAEWEPGGAALAFEVAEPGEYRLEVTLRPTLRRDGLAGFDLAVPRVANAQLELTLPDKAPLVEVPSACGAVTIGKGPPRLLADLGPAERLTVRWQEDAARAAGPAVDVEQFVWLKVQPGSLVIATKFKLRILEGQIQQVQLAADPRLRLLPLQGDDPPTVQTGAETGQSRLIAFRWPRPQSEQLTLEASFLLSGALGVGNFRLPQIELLDARPTKRWLAVSVDPALDREEQQKQRLEAVTVADFLKAWGAAEAKPQTAYRLPGGEINWSISTRPHEPRSTASQTLSLSCDEDHADLLFEAQLSTASGYLFQHRLAAPKGLKIESISLLEEGVERAGRWSQDADGAITIFLNGPASGEQKLVLRGQLPIGLGKPWPLPAVRVERCQIRSAAIRLYRRPSVLVTLQGQSPRTAVDAPAGDTGKPDLGRLVEAFSWDAAQPLSVTVTVEPNRLRTKAKK